MGKPAAKKGDKIVSATPGDIHIVMVPSPGGPVPTPLPHPCKSDLKMKLAEKVNVQGKPGAMKGSKSKHMPPHFPTPPGVSFQKPPKNEAEVFTASSNVNYEGRGAAMLGDTGMMCSDPSDTPVGVLVVPPGTVYVGGGMSGGAEARAQAKIAAMKAAAAECHKWINNNMPMGADREEAHRRVCEDTGHPVDVATGKVFTGVVVLRLRGRIPIRLAIDYSTARAQEDGPFGHGWRHELERHLLITDDFIAHRNQHGHFAAFAPIGAGEEAQNLADGLTLSHHGHYLKVRDANGLEDVFLLPEGYQKGSMLPLAGMRDAFGNAVRLHYDDQRLARITDSAGREVQLTYGRDSRVIQVLLKDDPQVAPQPIVTCRYDRTGDLIAVGDPLGHERRFAYDHHLLVQEIDRNGFSFYFAYDEAQRCVLTWGDGGKLYRRIAYDPERGLTHVVDGDGGQKLHRLAPLGMVAETTDPLGREWSKVWDEAGLLLSQTDPAGRAWTYGYDGAGRLVERSDPAGDTCEFAYDDAGRRCAVRYSQGAEYSIEYDPRTGRPMTKRFGEDGPEFRYVWSERGDLSEVWRDGGLRERYTYDDAGNLRRAERSGGGWLEREHDARGRVCRVRNHQGLSLELDWDARGQLCAAQRDSGPPMSFAYDPEGNVVRRWRGEADARFAYVAWNAPAEAQGSALRQDTRCRYDAENRLIELRKGNGGRHCFAYDPTGRLIAHRYPDELTEMFERDRSGRIVAVLDRGGGRSTFAYDRWGRLTAIEANGESNVLTYEDGLRATAWTTGAVAGQTEYGDEGRPVADTFAITDGPTFTVRLVDGWLTFDDDGVRTTHVGDGRGGLLGTICSAWSRAVRYRTTDARRVEIAFPNGMREILRYDRTGRRQGQEIVGPDGGILNRRTLLYDDTGDIIGIDDELRGAARYDLDLTGRLCRVERPGSDQPDEAYAYDNAENLSRDGEPWSFDACDRLLDRPGFAYAYDARGNRVEERRSRGGVTRYGYDAHNRLAEVVLPDGGRVEYAYDALRRRVRKRVGGRDTYYLWNGHLLVAERRPDGLRRTYIYHLDSFSLLGWVDTDDQRGARSYFVHSDHLGRPQEATDEAGRLVWAVDSDAFGRVRRMLVEEVDLPVRGVGQYADAETGLYYNRYRYFDPGTARFLSEDPLGLDPGLNLYGFNGNPIVQADPLGLCSGGNPAYDPRQAELEALRRIYNGSPGLQALTTAQTPEEILRAQRLLEQETGFTTQPWDREVLGRQPGEAVPGGGWDVDPETGELVPADRGIFEWELSGGERRTNVHILPDINEDPAGYRDTLIHEYSAVQTVRDSSSQRSEIPMTSDVAKSNRFLPRSGDMPISRNELLDNYVNDPQGVEDFFTDD